MENALEVIRRHMQVYPVDVYAIARELGIGVRRLSMPQGYSASITKVKEDNYRIDLNISDPATRQRFSLAHELGHFLYHRHLIGDGVSDSAAFRSPDTSVYENTPLEPHHESQANKFAANLLMPRELIARAEQEIGTNIPALAKAFEVSVPAMRVRKGLSPYPDPNEHFEFIPDEA